LSGGKLHIVTAHKPQHFHGTADYELPKSLDTGDLADSLLDDLASRARLAGVREVQTHAGSGDPADVICGIAQQVSADLVIVGNKGMTGVRRVLGSVPNSVAHQAPCSVLIVSTA
jgi:nucleotide-binding universal stress UspA family protein